MSITSKTTLNKKKEDESLNNEQTKENNYVSSQISVSHISNKNFEDLQSQNNLFEKKQEEPTSSSKVQRKILLKFSLAEFVKVFLEFKAQAYLFETPFMNSEKEKIFVKICIGLYKEAKDLLKMNYNILNPQQIQLKLSYAIFVYEILGDKERGREKIKKLFMNSLKDLNRYFLLD
mgnify:CR=1 FL=1